MKNNEEKDTNVLKIVGIIILVISIMLFCFTFFFMRRENNLADNSISKEKNGSIEEKILRDLDLDSYLGNILSPRVEIDVNLLDDSYYLFKYYFYSIDDFKKYNMQVDNDPSETYVFAKFSDYLDFYSSRFGDDAASKVDERSIYIDDLTLISDDFYSFDSSIVKECENVLDENCYVFVVLKGQETNSIEFSSLKTVDNTISGSLKLLHHLDGNVYHLNGTFEFEYFKENNNIYAKSLKIKSIDDALIKVE